MDVYLKTQCKLTGVRVFSHNLSGAPSIHSTKVSHLDILQMRAVTAHWQDVATIVYIVSDGLGLSIVEQAPVFKAPIFDAGTYGYGQGARCMQNHVEQQTQ